MGSPCSEAFASAYTAVPHYCPSPQAKEFWEPAPAPHPLSEASPAGANFQQPAGSVAVAAMLVLPPKHSSRAVLAASDCMHGWHTCNLTKAQSSTWSMSLATLSDCVET